MTKFAANDPSVLSNVPPERCVPIRDALEVGAPPDTEKKILGVRWDPQRDRLQIDIEVPQVRVATRRNILSAIMSQYDPPGIALP